MVAIDIDSVLLDLVGSMLKIYNEKTGETVTREEIKGWRMEDYVNPKYAYIIEDLFWDKNVYLKAPIIYWAVEGVEYLRTKDDVCFVTAAKPTTMEVKYYWLAKNGFLKDDKEFIVCLDKSLIRAKWLIDDGMHNIRAFIGNGVLFRQPWNEEFKHGLVLNSWREIKNVI